MPAGRATHRTRLLLAALLVASAPAWADYKSAYGQGLKAAREGDWARVEARMREALAQESTPAARVDLAGKNYQPYVPQFFLGIAAYKRGDCAAAVRNLEHGPTNTAVDDAKARPKLSEFTAVAAQGLRECQQRLVAAAPPVTQPVPPAPVPVDPTPPKPDPTPPKPDPTPPVVVDTRPVPPVQTQPPIRKPVPPPAPPVATATPAPAALTAALDNFLKGRYVEAAGVNPTQLSDPRARFHALLIRAAARHTLALVAGDPAKVLAGQAASDVRAAKALLPAQPDAALFSPRFRQFYTATR